MNILIVGDSFSDPKWAKNNYLSWPELLSTVHQVTNLSLAGSSTWWSYQNFKKHYTEYDYCIFTITVPTRVHLESTDQHLNINSNFSYKGISLEEVYYERFYSQEREDFLQTAIVKDFLNTPNTLAIPSFSESIAFHPGWSLCHISDLEADFYKEFRPLKSDNRRPCHLSKEGNQTIYKKIIEAIDNNDKILNISEADFIAPSDPKQVYWP